MVGERCDREDMGQLVVGVETFHGNGQGPSSKMGLEYATELNANALPKASDLERNPWNGHDRRDIKCFLP